MAVVAPLKLVMRIEQEADLPFGLSSRRPADRHVAETLDLMVGHYERGAMPEQIAEDYGVGLTFVQAVLAYWREVSA